jgi:hypothetical protein
MTTAAQLETLGLSVRTQGKGLVAQLEFSSSQMVNPVTRSFIHRAEFTVAGDRLLVVAPSELVGMPPIPVGELKDQADLEARLAQGLNEHIYHLQRRSTELQTLGLSPHVEPKTLQLSTAVTAGELEFLIASDKRGNFRVLSAKRNGNELTVSSTQGFELSEFRELSALVEYLRALFGEVSPRQGPSVSQEAPTPLLALGEVTRAFGAKCLLPPRTQLEVLVELHVAGETYRFVAARVHGQTFRGLLAGARGKLWAERFELAEFPGVEQLVARVLGVSAETVQVSGGR